MLAAWLWSLKRKSSFVSHDYLTIYVFVAKKQVRMPHLAMDVSLVVGGGQGPP